MIKIALVSDIHFGKDSRSTDFALPGQKIKDDVTGGEPLFGGLKAKLSEYKPNYIFCAGDLTSAGKPLEYMYCLEKLYELANEANVSNSNMIYCIGNHDVDWALIEHASKKEEYKQFDREFDADELAFLGKYYSGISHSWLHNIPFVDGVVPYRDVFSSLGPVPMTGVIDRDDLEIFILNSGFLCSNQQDVIHGKITDAQCEWLEDELKQRYEEHAISKKWKIVILHHHPFPYSYPISYPEYSTLEEGPKLQELCGKYGVNLVIHGHYHFPRAETIQKSGWNNPVTFISAGSLSVNQEGRLSGNIPNTFHLIQLEEYPHLIKLITYEYAIGYGWHEVLYNRDTLPLDPEMFFGALTIDDQEAKDIISRLPMDRPISYEDIDPKLKYIFPSHLNDLLQDVHGLNLSGSFPGRIQIHGSKSEE